MANNHPEPGQHAVIVSLPADLLRRVIDDNRYGDPLQVLIRHNEAVDEIDVDIRPGPHGTWTPISLIKGIEVEVRNEGGVQRIWGHNG